MTKITKATWLEKAKGQDEIAQRHPCATARANAVRQAPFCRKQAEGLRLNVPTIKR